MIRACLPWPHPILQAPAAPVAAITPDIRAIWQDMVDTMEAMPGYGLAAVQIGVPLRLAVVDASQDRGRAILLANPEILSSSEDLREQDEASPNLPGAYATIHRPRIVTIRYLNEDGVIEDRAFRDLWSASVQHQIDHLAGKMFFDRLSPLKRRMLLTRAGKKRGRG